MSLEDTVVPLLLFSTLRVHGLAFLIPGVAAGPDLASEFAVTTAYGDLASAVLARNLRREIFSLSETVR